MEDHAKENAIHPWIITAVIIAVVGFVGWWGLAKMGPQKMAVEAVSVEATSSEKALAPDFTLPSTTGGDITLSSFRGKKNVLIYFNEGLSCDQCIQQIPELEKILPELDKLNIQLLSVSLDPVDQWKEIIDQYHITTPILSYQDAHTEQDYSLLPYSMGMGRRAGHTFVLVGMDGEILWRRDYWPGYGMMVAGGTMSVDSKYILQAVQEHLAQH